MKYVVLLCDGCADRPIDELGGKTPMSAANKPNMNKLVKTARLGMVRTVAEGLKPGSDVANLSVMGYDPLVCYTGRSPLEAASIGIDLADDDVAFRCNIVTLSDEENYADKTMVDYCAGDISTEEAAEIIKSVQAALGTDDLAFYAGISYRHCMVWSGAPEVDGFLTPPHDISDKVIGQYLPKGEVGAKLLDLMRRSYDILKDHPVNKARVARGLRPANSIWLWGEGKRPRLQNFKERTGLDASVVSAVDLIKGIGKCAGMNVCEVEGATGYIDTNFEGKAAAAVAELDKGRDFVYIHVEAPDECGHRGELQNKIRSMELIDEKILGPVLEALPKYGDYKIMILPDHPTPLSIKTHSGDPVPFMIYDSRVDTPSGFDCFDEESGEKSGEFVNSGVELMNSFLAD